MTFRKKSLEQFSAQAYDKTSTRDKKMAMFCWQDSMRMNHSTAFVNSIPPPSSNRPYYNILMQRQPCYIQNQPMFPSSTREAASRGFDYPPCAKPPLSLGLGSLTSPSRLDESLVYQGMKVNYTV